MMTGLDVEGDIDRLYQLPLAEFTSARNDLARRVGGAKGAEIRALRKPPVAAWAVNQLYWRNRAAYDGLAAAAAGLRQAQEAALGGGAADLRKADRAYDAAIKDAFDAAMTLLQESGHAASASTREAVRRTLRAMPAEGRPGRLENDLSPGGFEALAGIPVGEGQSPHQQPSRPPPGSRPAAEKTPLADRPPREPAREPRPLIEGRRREEIFEATRAVREAEREVRRAEDAAAEAQRDLDRRLADEARAEAQLGEASSRASEARSKLSAAQASVKRSASARERAQARLERLRTRE